MIPAASVLLRHERHAGRRKAFGGLSHQPAATDDDEGSSDDMPRRSASYEEHLEWQQRRDAQTRQRERENRHRRVEVGDGEITDENWQLFGLCRQTDPDMFFPEKEGDFQGGSYRDAQKVCDTPCPVKDRCLDWALRHDERYGIWGGKTYNQRRVVQGKAPRGATA